MLNLLVFVRGLCLVFIPLPLLGGSPSARRYAKITRVLILSHLLGSDPGQWPAFLVRSFSRRNICSTGVQFLFSPEKQGQEEKGEWDEEVLWWSASSASPQTQGRRFPLLPPTLTHQSLSKHSTLSASAQCSSRPSILKWPFALSGYVKIRIRIW